MNLVDKCPKTLVEVTKASKRLGCGHDTFETDQYMCLPNAKTSSLVEFCYNGIMGIKEKGNCLQVNTADGKVSTRNCTDFAHGCPERHFWNNEFYMFPDCQNINQKDTCYVAQPKCPTLGIVTDDHDSLLIHIILPVAASVVVVIILFMIMWFIWSRKKKKQDTTTMIKDEEESLKLLESTTDEEENGILGRLEMDNPDERSFMSKTYPQSANHLEKNVFMDCTPKMNISDERTLMSKTYPPFKGQS